MVVRSSGDLGKTIYHLPSSAEHHRDEWISPTCLAASVRRWVQILLKSTSSSNIVHVYFWQHSVHHLLRSKFGRLVSGEKNGSGPSQQRVPDEPVFGTRAVAVSEEYSTEPHRTARLPSGSFRLEAYLILSSPGFSKAVVSSWPNQTWQCEGATKSIESRSSTFWSPSKRSETAPSLISTVL